MNITKRSLLHGIHPAEALGGRENSIMYWLKESACDLENTGDGKLAAPPPEKLWKPLYVVKQLETCCPKD